MVIFTLLLSTFASTSQSQISPFIPPVYNYTTEQYNAANQNWSVAQGSDGVLYFGNDNGMLSYDGVNWALHYLPNNLSAKSIHIDSSNAQERIYVGSFEEFGYFERDENNRLIYFSLKQSITGYTFRNDEIWSIFSFEGKIYFQSFSSLFAYDGETPYLVKPAPSSLYFFPAGEKKMYVQHIDGNFSLFDGEHFQQIFSKTPWSNNDNVVALLPSPSGEEEEWLLATSKSGLFIFSEKNQNLIPWRTPGIDELLQNNINRVIYTDSIYIFGTLNNGIYAITKGGDILWHIYRGNGLNNNTVLALFCDRDNTVWATLDNGISNIRISSSLSFFEPTDQQIGPVEDILAQDNRLYLATNQGIYSYPDANGKLFRIPGLDIQSWFIKSFDNQIFVGHNRGTSFIENLKGFRLDQINTGGTDMKLATINSKEVLLESSYSLLFVYQKNHTGNWSYSHTVEGFSDLIKNLEIDHAGNIWAGHMYKGVYRLKFDENLRKVVEVESHLSFDSTQTNTFRPIKVMKLRGRIVFADGKQFFTYDDINQKIISFTPLNEDLPGFADTHRIIPVNDRLFWFIRHQEYVLVEFDGSNYLIKDRIPYSILNNPPNVGRANLLVTGDSTALFSMNGGVGKYTIPRKNAETNVELKIAAIESYTRNKDKTIYLSPRKRGEIAFRNNNILFRLQYPEFSKKLFSTESYLEGYDEKWINTNADRTISYQNLPAGNYTLFARVKDSSGKVVGSTEYSFRINNPWYKTVWAYLIYLSISLLLARLLINRHIKNELRKEQKIYEEQEQRRLTQIARQEKEIASLRNERLEAELTHKGKELASAAMMLINHSEFLKGLRENIQKLILNGKINRTEGNELLALIGKNLSEEDEWDLFQKNFDLIHENFFRNLKERFPSLTPTDLKLCALLRLNYSSKEIADMLSISVRGVEAARYRLRKKLQLAESDNLVDFMISFQ